MTDHNYEQSGPGHTRFISLDERDAQVAAEREQARHDLEAMHPLLSQPITKYREAVAEASRGHAEFTIARNAAPCPICGRRSAILSHGDLGGPTVELYCTNDDCPAREIAVAFVTHYDPNNDILRWV